MPDIRNVTNPVSPSPQQDQVSLPDPNAAPSQDVVPEGSLSLQGDRPQLSPDIAENRAQKADTALGHDSPGYDNLLASIQSGAEDSMRDVLSQQDALRFQQQKLQVIMNHAQMKAEKGEPITPTEMKFYQDMSRSDFSDFQKDPKTFLEGQYAKDFMSKYVAPTPTSQQAQQEDPVAHTHMLNAVQTAVEHKQVAQTVLEDLEAKYNDLSGTAKMWSFGKQLIPLWSWYNMENAVKDAPTTSLLQGGNREEQYQYLASLPTDKYQEALKAAAEDIATRNPLDAITFVQGAMSYSLSDHNMDNAMNIADAATVGEAAVKLGGGFAKTAVKAGERAINGRASVKALRESLKDAAQATAGKATDTAAAEVAAGRFDAGVAETAIKKFKDQLAGKDPLMDGVDLRNEVPSIFNPGATARDLGSFTREAADAVVDKLQTSAKWLQEAMTAEGGVTRLGPDALKVAIQRTADSIKARYSAAADSILEVRGQEAIVHHNAEDNAARVHAVSIYFGDKDKKLFDSPQHATWYALQHYGLGDSQFRLQKVADDAYAVVVTKNINEAADAVRDVLIDTTRKSNVNTVNTFLGWLRSANDLVSPAARANRIAATAAPQELSYKVKQAAEPLMELSKDKKAMQDLERILVANRDVKTVNPKTGEIERGKFYKNVGELEQAYQDAFKRMPTAKETAAYFNYVQLMDFDYVMRNLGLYRDFTRLGAENIKVNGIKEIGKGLNEGTYKPGQISFAGVIKDKLPFGSKEDAGVFIQHHGKETGDYVRLNAMSEEQRAQVEKLMQDHNYKVVQIFNPTQKPLRHTAGTDETIHYMLTNRYATDRLKWDILPYRPGGHVEYQHQWFVKQPKIRRADGYFSGQEEAQYPAVPEGHTRLFRGEGPHDPNMVHNPGEAPGRHFTGSHIEAKNYADMNNGHVYYVDVPTSKVKFDPNSGHRQYTRLDEATASQKKLYVKEVQRQTGKRHIYEGDISMLNVATEAEAKKFAQAADKARLMIKNGDAGADDFIRSNLPWTPKEFRLKFEKTVDQMGREQPPMLHIDDPIVHTFTGRNTSDELGHQFFKDKYENFENDIRNPHNLFGQVDKKFAGERNADLDHYGFDDQGLKLASPKLIDPFTSLNRSLANVMRSRYFTDYKISAVEEWVQEFKDVLDIPLDQLREDPMWHFHNPKFDTTNTNRERLAAANNVRNSILNLLGTESETSKNVNWMVRKLQNEIYDRLGKKYSDKIAESNLQAVKDPMAFLRSVAFHTKLGFFNPIQLVMQAQTIGHVMALGGTQAAKGIPAGMLMMRMALTRDPAILDKFAEIATNFGWKKDHFVEAYQHLMQSGYYHIEGETAWKDDIFNPKVIQTPTGNFLDHGLAPFRIGERFVRLSAWGTAYQEWRLANPLKRLDNVARNQILQRAETMGVNMTRASSASWQKGIMSIPTQFLAYNVRMAEQFIGGRLTVAERARLLTTYSLLYGVPVAAGAATTIPFYDNVRQWAIEKGINVDGAFFKTFTDGVIAESIHALGGKDYNISQRMGPGGLRLWQDIFSGNKNSLELAVGASGGVAGQMLLSMYPALRLVTDVFSEDPSDRWGWTAEDTVGILSNVSTLGNAAKTIMMMNTHKYISKNEVDLGEVNNFDALAFAFLGVTPQKMNDSYLMMKSMKDLSDTQKKLTPAFIAEYRRGLKEAADGNVDIADVHLRRAKNIFIQGGWQPNQKMQLIKQAVSGYESIMDKIPSEFVLKAPPSQREDRLQQLIRTQGQQ